MNFILAGDSINYHYNRLNLHLENVSIGELKPSKNSSSSTSSEDTPINIDNDPLPDIRFGDYILYQNDYAISKAFVVSNNYGNDNHIEFAIKQEMVLSLNKCEYLVALFNESDTINANQKWTSSNEPKCYFISLVNTFEPYFTCYKGTNVEVNKNINNKYIALRRRIGADYVYGWLRVSVSNCEKLSITGSSFSFWYKKKKKKITK
jgi:hypothetical protein